MFEAQSMGEMLLMQVEVIIYSWQAAKWHQISVVFGENVFSVCITEKKKKEC